MFCKLLILKDKLRVALEWIHSQGRAAEHGYSPGLSMAGNSTECRAGTSSRKETEPQGLTEQQEPATLRSIETKQKGTSSEPAEPHKMRENQSSRRKGAQGLQGYRAAEQSRSQCERKETDTAQGRTQPSEPAAASSKPHETQQSRTGCKCRAASRTSRTSTKGHPQPCRGATGEAGSASGRRVSRMSAPNLGAHRTPTLASRQSASLARIRTDSHEDFTPVLKLLPTLFNQRSAALLPQNCGVAVQQHEIFDVLDQIGAGTRQLLRVLKATRGRHEYRRSLRL